MLLSQKKSRTFKEEAVKKIIDPEHLETTVNDLKSQGVSIVTLNGSFDLLHAGHLEILYQASLQADCLIVGLNSDLSIQRYKGSDRPIIPLRYRLQMMAALKMVSFVSWFDETDPREWLKKIRPDVHANGAEYGEHCVEAETVKQLGGRLFLIERIDGLATSQIIKKIHTLCD